MKAGSLVVLSVVLAGTLVLSITQVASAAEVVKANQTDTFSPKAPHVSRGDKVVWKNVDTEDHNVTATSSNWTKVTTIAAGTQTSFTFHQAGTYRYECTLHSGMTGKIVVS